MNRDLTSGFITFLDHANIDIDTTIRIELG